MTGDDGTGLPFDEVAYNQQIAKILAREGCQSLGNPPLEVAWTIYEFAKATKFAFTPRVDFTVEEAICGLRGSHYCGEGESRLRRMTETLTEIIPSVENLALQRWLAEHDHLFNFLTAYAMQLATTLDTAQRLRLATTLDKWVSAHEDPAVNMDDFDDDWEVAAAGPATADLNATILVARLLRSSDQEIRAAAARAAAPRPSLFKEKEAAFFEVMQDVSSVLPANWSSPESIASWMASKSTEEGGAPIDPVLAQQLFKDAGTLFPKLMISPQTAWKEPAIKWCKLIVTRKMPPSTGALLLSFLRGCSSPHPDALTPFAKMAAEWRDAKDPQNKEQLEREIVLRARAFLETYP